MPYINVNDVYIMDNTGKQVDDAVDYALANSNRNLADNAWWGSNEVINQRDTIAAPSTNGSYTIDRWIYTTGATANTMSIGSNGITFTIASSSIWFAQRLANSAALAGKTLTASVLLGDGTIKSGTAVFTGTAQATFMNQAGLILYLTASGEFSIRISSTTTIRAVKLELGSYSTLANDVPPDYGEELRKCQRYFVRIASSANAFPVGFGVKDSATIADIFVPTPVEMRVTPSTSKKGTHRVWGGNAASRDVSSYSTVAKTTTGVYLRATISSGSLADYYTYVIYLQSGAYIDLSADL